MCKLLDGWMEAVGAIVVHVMSVVVVLLYIAWRVLRLVLDVFIWLVAVGACVLMIV